MPSIVGDLRWSARLHGLAWRDFATGVGWLCCLPVLAFPLVARLSRRIRRHSSQHRALAAEYAQRTVFGDYPEALDPLPRGYTAAAVDAGRFVADAANRRDLFWHLVNLPVGGLLTLLPFLVLGSAIWGWLQPFLFPVWGRVVDHPWPLGFPVHDETTAVLGALWCLVVVLILGRHTHRVLDLHGRWVAARLRVRSEQQLQRRIERLTQSRQAVLDLQSQEYGRIERDLHDGPQAKLVGSGMALTAAEALVTTDPDQVLQLIGTAKTHISAALEEIRALARGIRPPVLVDRGLADALRAVAADSMIDTTVDIDLTEPVESPLDTALYFAITECLTNAIKHSEATMITITLGRTDGGLVAEVIDNGLGGAMETPGGGLAGIRQRLVGFDATTTVASPPGGPTRIQLVIPWPRQPAAQS